MSHPRALDHLVLPVRSLEAARADYERLGFLVAPDARHPFGTSNACVFLADGFYEWQKLDEKGKRKQPYLIRHPQEKPFAMAGIFERWMSPNGSEIDTCAILTTSANATMSAVHDRMPVIIPRAKFEDWLSPDATVKEIENLMRPLDDDALELVKIDAVQKDEV